MLKAQAPTCNLTIIQGILRRIFYLQRYALDNYNYQVTALTDRDLELVDND